MPSIDFDTQGSPEIPLFDPARENIAAPKVNYNPDYNPFKSSGKSSGSSWAPRQDDTPTEGWETLYDGLMPSKVDAATPSQPSEAQAEDFSFFHVQSSMVDEQRSPDHYQYKGKYLMTAVKSGLMIIDQYRADVRIRYERYMNQLQNHTASTQKVLFPETVQFSPSEAVTMQQLLPDLSAIGFDLSDLGGNTYAVNGVPVGTEGLDPVALIQCPLEHHGGHSWFMSALSVGATVVICGKFDPQGIFEQIDRYGVTHMILLPPTTYLRLVREGHPARHRTDTLRIVQSAAGGMTPEIAHAVFDAFPNADINYGWGQSESGVGTSMRMTREMLSANDPRIASVGRPMETLEVRIVDEQGFDVAVNTAV